MIGYTMVGTTDLRRAERFYDPVMALIGQERCYCDEQVSSWGRKDDGRVSSPVIRSTTEPPPSAMAP